MGRQGLISGLGAGLSLVIAGVVSLTLLTTLVAFDGLSAVEASRDIAEIRLPATPPPAREAGDPDARPAARRAVRLQPRARAQGAVPRTPVASPPLPDGRGEGRLVPRDATPGVPAPAPAPPPQQSAPPAPAPAITPDALEDVTRQVQEVLDPVVGAAEEVTGLVPVP